jgi:hypothetical protein
MTCHACATARDNPHTGLLQVGCHGCRIRDVARSPFSVFAAELDALPEDQRAAFKAEVLTEYRRIKAARSL